MPTLTLSQKKEKEKDSKAYTENARHFQVLVAINLGFLTSEIENVNRVDKIHRNDFTNSLKSTVSFSSIYESLCTY